MTTTSVTGVEVRDAGVLTCRGRRVLLAAYQQYATAMPPAVFGRYLAELLDVEARAEVGRILVAEVGGRVVGTVTYYPDAAAEGLGWPAGWAGLRALGVEPGARGRGVGRALMEACRRRAEAGGADVLCLHTDQFKTAAVAIYAAMGFRRAPAFDFDATKRFALGGVGPVPVLGYRLDLSRQTTRSMRWTPRRSVSAPCTRTRSPGNGRSCGSRPRRPTASCWSSTCTSAPAGGWPASTSTRPPPSRSRR